MPVWTRDIDKQANPVILRRLADKTATALTIVEGTTLRSFEGFAYERHNAFGNTTWILPLGIYHRLRRRAGLQFCPRCLADDQEPYFRRHWRLAFVVACVRHRIRLLDRCPRCAEPVNFHRNKLDEPMTQCHGCRYDLRRARPVRLRTRDRGLLRLQLALLQAMEAGAAELGGQRVYAHHYLQVVRQVLKTFVAHRTCRLWRTVEAARGGGDLVGSKVVAGARSRIEVEHLPVDQRLALLAGAAWLLDHWPGRFVRVCLRARCWSSDLLRDMRATPYCYRVIVREWLYRPGYAPSDAEFVNARAYLKSHGLRAGARNVSHLLGVTDAVRKHPGRRKAMLAGE